MDEDVLDDLKSEDMAPVDLQAISHRSPTGRQVWRVSLSDGRTVKVRRAVRRSSTAPHLNRILERLPLAGLESLEPRLRKLAPEDCLWGLIHGDFCGSNLVRVDSERVFCIDNEWQREGPIPYDLARTLTLWNLSPAEETSFLQAYYGPEPARAPELYWVLSALVESIHNRRKGKLTTVDVPLQRLKFLLQQIPDQSLENSHLRSH